MNFKKVLSIASVASVAVVGLVSCGKDNKKKSNLSNLDPSTYTGDIVTAVNYNNLGYMTYGRGNTSKVTWASTYTTVDGRTLVEKDSMTPIWQDIATNMKCKLVDGSPTGDNTQTVMKNLITKSYVGYNDKNIQLLQITTAEDFTNAVDKGDFINISDYLDFMPNLNTWLNEHEVIKNQLTMFGGTSKEGIYYTPYFDGLDQQELAFNMNIDIVRALLDDNPAADNKYDDTNNVKAYVNGSYDETAAKNFVSDFKYTTPYIKSIDTDLAVGASDGSTGHKIHVTIKEGDDIITRMSNLTTKNGKTLVECLKKYIDDIYGDYIGSGKTYANRSEVFTSVASAYNADELIALLRCVKANPGYLTGNASAEMTPFFPRTGERNRVTSYYDIAQIWGLRGTGRGEYDKAWLNSDGKVVDGKTQGYNLYCLELCRQLQEEKLFATTNKWYQDGAKASADWRQQVMTQGTAFMCYDYTNVAAYNSDKNEGIAPTTGAAKRNVCANMQAVLSPYAKWAFNTEDGTLSSKNKIVGADSSNKFSYTRFTEDDRSLKNGGWSIVAKNVTDEEQLKKCLEIMDYLYSAEGSVLECFGYNDQATDAVKATGWKKGADGKYIQQDADGNYYVNLSDSFKNEQVARTAGTWHNFMTMFWGSCLGVGNIRSNYLEAQLTGTKQTVGTEKLSAAMGSGALYLAKTSGQNFLSVVPTTCSLGQTESDSIAANCKDLNNFWASEKAGDGGWSSQYLQVIYGGWQSNTSGFTSADAVGAKFDDSNKTYLKFVAAAWGKKSTTEDQYSFLGLSYKTYVK